MSAKIGTMLEAPDEFALYLRKLRKERGLAAHTLSGLIGKGNTFVGKWEREPTRKPNRAALLRLADVLSLPEPERLRLFRLADQRGLPEAAKRYYDPAAEPLRNVRDALLTVEHDSESFPSESAVEGVCSAASWLWAAWGAASLSYEACYLRWPSRLYKLGLIEPENKRLAKWDIPDNLIHDELPDLDALTEATDTTVHTVAAGMAAVYRRWFLADPARCRGAANATKHWWCADLPSSGLVIAFAFRDTDEQVAFGVPGARCDVVEAVSRRDLASSVCKVDTLPEKLETIDLAVLGSFSLAKSYLDAYRGIAPWSLWQSFGDAYYVLKAGWRPAPRPSYDPSPFYSLASTIETGRFEDVPPPGIEPTKAHMLLADLYGSISRTLRTAQLEIERHGGTFPRGIEGELRVCRPDGSGERVPQHSQKPASTRSRRSDNRGDAKAAQAADGKTRNPQPKASAKRRKRKR